MTPPQSSPEAVARWLTEQRWFARPVSEPGADGSDEPAVPFDVSLSEPMPLPDAPRVGLVLATTSDGHRYQLLLPTGGKPRRAGPTDGAEVVDVADGADAAKALARLSVDEAGQTGPFGTVQGHWMPGVAPPGRRVPRGLGADQTNTSTVVGGTHVLKVLRRLAAGPHPEVEVGRHLHEQAAATGTPLPIAPLAGWYELVEPTGERTTLGVLHRLVPGALDGWGLVLSALAADPGTLLTRLHHLGADLARLHGALARPGHDGGSGGGFGAEPVTAAYLAATARATVTAVADLEATVGHHLVTRVDQTLGALVADLGGTDAGVAIRTHGDLHLGQTVVGPDGWVILDFEGEPARTIEERRRHHPALRDVAGLLRSLSYAAETVRRAGGDRLTDGWEPAARAALLDGYLATVDPSLVPASAAATVSLLSLFEVEKAVYEISYELAHRPDWVHLPVTGLARVVHRLDRHGAVER